jgi:hypothetical protein
MEDGSQMAFSECVNFTNYFPADSWIAGGFPQINSQTKPVDGRPKKGFPNDYLEDGSQMASFELFFYIIISGLYVYVKTKKYAL